jgi:hypothetical protein
VKPYSLFLLLVALVLSSCAISPREAARLPRIPLRGGGEFRVLHISYGTDHRFKNVHRLRLHPESVQDVKDKHTFTQVPAVAIWWGTVEPESGEYRLGPVGPAFLLLPEERKQLLAKDAFGDVRRLFIYQPRRDQQTLRIRIPVTAPVRGAKNEWVEFEISNPAYTK